MRRLRIRLRPLSEAEAYARCHGRRETEVRIVHLEPRRPRYELRVTGEDLRRSFEQRLDAREPHEPATVNEEQPTEEPSEVAAADGLPERVTFEAEAAASARRG